MERLRIDSEEACIEAEQELHELLKRRENELSDDELLRLSELSDAIEDYEARTYPDWTC